MALLSAELLDALPTPVARLLHRASLTRDPKLRHDHALGAWEVTFRLVVASHPPDDLTSLREPSMGHWRQALRLPKGRPSRTPGLLKAVAFFRHHAGLPDTAVPSSISSQALVEPLPAYRNRCSTAHTTPRSEAFYREASEHLLLSLAIAWQEQLFWPASAQLVLISHVELDARGQRHARVLSLQGALPQLLEEDAVVDDHLLPERVYLREGGQFTSLFPWVLCHQQSEHHHFYLFQSSHRGLTFLDCDSGEPLSREQLEARGLPVHDPLAPAADAALLTPLPPSMQPTEAPYRVVTTRERQPSLGATTRPNRRWLPLAGLLVALGVLGAGGFRLVTGLAWSDWGFHDREQGLGWLERARGHLASGNPRAAAAAVQRGLAAAQGQAAHESELLLLAATVDEQQGEYDKARQELLKAWERQPSAVTEQRLEDACSHEPPLEEPYRQAKIVRGSSPVILYEDALKTKTVSTLEAGRCVWVAQPSFPPQGGHEEVQYKAAVRRGSRIEQGWLRAQDVAPGDSAATWLRRAQTAFTAGNFGDIMAAIREGLKALRTSPDDRAQLFLLKAQVHRQHGEELAALEAFIDSYKMSSLKTRTAAAEGIETLCAHLGPPRPAGDERVYKAVSWGERERSGNLRDNPAMTSAILAEIPRPTCVLAGVAKTVAGNTWYPVEMVVKDEKRQGWMHQVVLSP